MKLSQDNIAKAETQWNKLRSGDWEIVTDKYDKRGDPPLWKKRNAICTVFLTELEKGFEFSLHGLDDDVILEQLLTATDFDSATKQCDELTAQFMMLGALREKEIRIQQAFTAQMGTNNQNFRDEIFAVGIDGILYRRSDSGYWFPERMKLA